MLVIAKTKEGVLIEASDSEVEAILSAVTGKKPSEIDVGQKIPAIDYSATISKIKSLNDNSYFKDLVRYSGYFQDEVEKLKTVVEQAAKLEV